MKRFFGMMPSSEVEVEKTYIDSCDLKITVQAGPNGYSIIYADHSTEYEDVEDTTENNLQRALDKIKSHNLEIRECDESDDCECCEESCECEEEGEC